MADTLHQIKHRFTDEVLFELKCGSLPTGMKFSFVCITREQDNGR